MHYDIIAHFAEVKIHVLVHRVTAYIAYWVQRYHTISERDGIEKKKGRETAISTQHKISVGWKADCTYRPLHGLPTFRVLVVDGYRVTAKLSRSDKLLDGFLDRSRWLPALRV